MRWFTPRDVLTQLIYDVSLNKSPFILLYVNVYFLYSHSMLAYLLTTLAVRASNGHFGYHFSITNHVLLLTHTPSLAVAEAVCVDVAPALIFVCLFNKHVIITKMMRSPNGVLSPHRGRQMRLSCLNYLLISETLLVQYIAQKHCR